jgi:uncharacterized protein (DUF1697 family)
MRQVAFLRGINVGGRHLVPMQALRACLTDELHLVGVRTYIQSGNVVFDSDQVPEALSPAIAAALEARFGFAVPVVVRSAEWLARVVADNPFLAEGADPKALHVGLLSSAPASMALDPERSPPDRFAVAGQQVYLHCPNGLARTKLTVAWFERGLGVETVTVRNWRTLGKVLDLAQA